MKDMTYGSFSCDYKPNKEEKERTRLTVGGIIQMTVAHQQQR